MTAATVLEPAESPQSRHLTSACKLDVVLVPPLEAFGGCALGMCLEQCLVQSKLSVVGYCKNRYSHISIQRSTHWSLHLGSSQLVTKSDQSSSQCLIQPYLGQFVKGSEDPNLYVDVRMFGKS